MKSNSTSEPKKEPRTAPIEMGPASMTLEVYESHSSMGRAHWFKVLKSPVESNPRVCGYGGIPLDLAGLRVFSGLRIRVTVEVVGIDAGSPPRKNPWAMKYENGKQGELEFIRYAKSATRHVIRILSQAIK